MTATQTIKNSRILERSNDSIPPTAADLNALIHESLELKDDVQLSFAEREDNTSFVDQKQRKIISEIDWNTEEVEMLIADSPIYENAKNRITHRVRQGVPGTRKVIKQYEGVISAIKSDGTIFASIEDLTGNDTEQDITFKIEQFCSTDDRKEAQIGSVFYWLLGFAKSPKGQEHHFSEMRLQRLGIWTKRKIDEGKAEGAELYKYLTHVTTLFTTK